MSNKVLYIVGGIFVVLALIAVAGLGFWAYQSNVKLNATQKELASLQKDYAQLKADNGQLSTNLDQANTSLAQTKSDLAKAQSDLTQAKSDNAALQAKLDKVKPLLTVTDAIFVTGGSDSAIQSKIRAVGDTRLNNLWDAFFKEPTSKTFESFLQYLFETIDSTVE